MHKTLDMEVRRSSKLSVAATYAAPAGHHYPRHRHATWELIYYRSGHIHCVLEDEVIETSPGMVLTIPPRTLHFDLAHTAYSQLYFRLERSALLSVWPHIAFDSIEGTLDYLFGTLVRK